jgi:predicted nucleic acid-binding protein
LNEPGSEEAKAIVADALKKGSTPHTSDIALAESLNALWKHATIFKDIKKEEIATATEQLAEFYDRLDIITTRDCLEKTMHIALNHDIAVYDACFVAATQKVNGTLYSADQKLCAVASKIVNVKMLKS